MNKIIIPVIAGILILGIGLSQDVYAPNDQPERLTLGGTGYAKAIPDWVKNQFQWYVNGEIEETTLLTSMNWMFDNNIMHLSEKAAQEMRDLREENTAYKKKLDSDGILGPNTVTSSKGAEVKDLQDQLNKQSSEQALNHLRKAYDLNPSLQTKVVQYDKDHDKWIDVLSIDWGATSTQGDPDRPIIIGRIYSQDQTGDMALKASKIKENYVAAKLRPLRDVVVLGTVTHGIFDNIMIKNGGTASAWKNGIASFAEHGMHESVVDDLQGIVVLCNTEIDKKTKTIDAELTMIEEWLKIIQKKATATNTSDRVATAPTGTTSDSSIQYNESDLDFITRKLGSIDQQINSLDMGLSVLKQKLQTVGDDAQLANIDLQDQLQKQQQTLQTMSNVSKMLHDTAMSVIRKIG